MSTAFSRLPHLALTVYLLLMALVVFQPQPELASGSVVTVDGWLDWLRLPGDWLNAVRVEFLMNTILFMPLPFLGAWVWPRLRVGDWVLISFVGSAVIEVTQGLFLASRSAQHVDIVSNTLGGLLGGILGVVVVPALLRRHSRPSA